LDRLIVSLRESPYASDLGLIQKNANRLLRVINQRSKGARIKVKGVRTSWETFVKNWSFCAVTSFISAFKEDQILF